MVCNLAVAITKAAIEDSRLRALVDNHIDQVQQMLVKFLARRHPNLSVQPSPRDPRVILAGPHTLRIMDGQVTVSGPRQSKDLADTLGEQAKAFLPVLADQFFAQEVGRLLRAVAEVTNVQTSEVDNNGVLQRATVFSLRIADLLGRVFVLPGGRVQIFVDTGSFPRAKAVTEQLLSTIQAQGLPVRMIGEVEQHRDGADHVHVPQRQKGPLRS